MIELKKMYQKAAVLRHKFLRRKHKKKVKRMEDAQKAFTMEEADRLS